MKDLETQLKEAIDNLARIRDTYKDDPELLFVYEPSAIFLVDLLESVTSN